MGMGGGGGSRIHLTSGCPRGVGTLQFIESPERLVYPSPYPRLLEVSMNVLNEEQVMIMKQTLQQTMDNK
jgi:hypothetical protein